MEVLDRDKLIKEYTALAFAEGHGQFGDTLTEMREKPSLGVRQNIEAQMRGDAEVLQQRVKQLHGMFVSVYPDQEGTLDV